LKSVGENKSGVVAFGLLDLLVLLYAIGPVLFFAVRLLSIKYPAANWGSVVLGLALGAAFAGLSIRYPTMRLLNASTAISLFVSAAVIGISRLRH
jgi:hypothetical protein